MADVTHLGGRVAVGDTDGGARFDNWGGRPVPREDRLLLELAAAEYVARLSRGETGAAHLYLREQRQLGVDPWRLAEMVAARALAVPADHGAGAGEAAPAPGAITAASAPAAAAEREDGGHGAQ
jgi:hypothetical protein